MANGTRKGAFGINRFSRTIDRMHMDLGSKYAFFGAKSYYYSSRRYIQKFKAKGVTRWAWVASWKFTFAKGIDQRVGCCRPLHANMSLLAGWYPSKSCQTAQKTDCTVCMSKFQVLVPTLCLRATRTPFAHISIISHSSPYPFPPHPHCPPPCSCP